MAAAEYAERYD